MIPSDKMDSIQLTFHNLLFVPPGFNLLFPRGFFLALAQKLCDESLGEKLKR